MNIDVYMVYINLKNKEYVVATATYYLMGIYNCQWLMFIEFFGRNNYWRVLGKLIYIEVD